jgi:release factor glutamine methyltransferase
MPALQGPLVQLSEHLIVATRKLAEALSLPPREARLEAQILFAHALGVNRAWLIGHDRDLLSPSQHAAAEFLLNRRLAGEPVAYLLGKREFYGRPFKVTPDVLIPRPDTELLVELALERLAQGETLNVLDVGVGAGAVAVSLALERPSCRVTAVDISDAALRVARANAQALRASLEFFASDVYSALGERRFHLIVSNPPYIAAADPHLAQGDLRYEPPQALASGGDGLDLIRRLVAEATAHLEAGGWLLMEHGWDQAAAVRSLLSDAGFDAIFSASDLAGHERVTGGSRATQLPDAATSCFS